MDSLLFIDFDTGIITTFVDFNQIPDNVKI